MKPSTGIVDLVVPHKYEKYTSLKLEEKPINILFIRLIVTIFTIFSVLRCSICFQGNLFKNIFDFTRASDSDFVAAVERLPSLHYSVDFIFLSFGIMGFIVDV